MGAPSAFAQSEGRAAFPPPSNPYTLPPPTLGYRPFSLLDDEGEPREVWYGWQALIVHGMSASMLAVTPAGDGAGAIFTAPTAIGGLVFASPIVHWSHGHVARGFASLGLQLGGYLVGALAGGAVAVGAVGGGNDSGLAFYIGALFGGPVGATTAFAIDVAVLAYDPLTEKAAADMAKGWGLPKLVPVVDVRKDRATFGVGGAF